MKRVKIIFYFSWYWSYIIREKKYSSLKYQRFTSSGGKDIGIRKSEFVTKTQFL